MTRRNTARDSAKSTEAAHGQRPAPDFVVSRDINGRALSFYMDFRWDWTPYTKDGRPRYLNFRFWSKAEPSIREIALVEELHWLMFLMVFRRRGSPLSYQTLCHYLKMLRAVSRHCCRNRISLRKLLEQENLLVDFFASDGDNDKHAKDMASLVSTLGALGKCTVGFTVPGLRLHTRLRDIATSCTRNHKQHPPLPTRIYAHVLSTLARDVTDFSLIAERFFALARVCSENKYLGRSTGRRYVIARNCDESIPEDATSFARLVSQFDGVEKYLRDRGFKTTVHGLSSALTEVQIAARLTVQAFTGMRSDEVSLLPLDCLLEEHANGKVHAFLLGSTSKFNRGRVRQARWVTSREGARAVRLAQQIARFILTVGLPNHKWSADKVPLFPSTGHLPLGRRAFPISRSGRLHAPSLDMDHASILRKRLQIAIIEEDLIELEHIDPHRAWRSEDAFMIGVPWTLTSHQFRRSLALYAHRSGLVSLPSLKRQLQHITEEMSRYYARGSAYAKDLIGRSKRHFGHEWQQTAHLSAALSYIGNVMLSTDVLFGGHANWVHRFCKKDGKVVVNRKKTIEAFRRGEIAYRETPLGGCTSTTGCDQIAVRWLNVDCLAGCKNLVGKLDRLETVIAAQGRLVSCLDADSVEYRSERENLEVLSRARDRVLADQMRDGKGLGR